jgi:hypothetical protein
MASEARLQFDGAYRVMASLGDRAVGSWLRYTLGPVSDLLGHRLSVVAYEDLLDTPSEVLSRIVSRHEGWDPPDGAWADAAGSIRNDLRHNRAAESELDLFPGLVRNAYDAVRKLSRENSSSFDNLLGMSEAFDTWVAMFSEPPPPPGKLGLAWLQDGRQSIAEARYQPTGSWQSVRTTIDAPPRTLTSGLLYGLPSRIWIRRAVWKYGASVTPATLRVGPASSLSRSGAILRLDAAFEPNQISLETPGGSGPYQLDIEFLLQTGSSIESDAATRIGKALDQCSRAAEGT